MGRPRKDQSNEPKPDIVMDLIDACNAVGQGGKAYLQEEHKNITCGIDIPYMAFQWLIGGSTVLPIQRMIGFAGLPKSMKSTLIVEIGNWFIMQGGVHVMIDNESKTSPTMLAALTWHNDELATKIKTRRLFKETSSMDQWQKVLTEIHKRITAYSDKPKGEREPFFVTVDSLTGSSTEDSQNKIQEEGSAATRDFPAEALKLSRYLDSFRLTGSTMNFGYVQQLKQDIGAMPGYGGPRYREKGAVAAAFATSVHIRVSKRMGVNYLNHPHAKLAGPPVEGYTLNLEATKTCVGPDGRDLDVDILWQYVPVEELDEDGKPVMVNKQVMWFDWHGALGRLLFNLKYNDKMKLVAYEKERLKKTLDFSGTATLKKSAITCDELGLEDATFAQFGEAIEKHPEISKRMRNYFNIQKSPNIQFADIDLGAKKDEDSD